MEFDEIKKIWDAQTNQPLYAIDEKTLHKRIQSQMTTVRRLANISEWFQILIYFGVSGILLDINRFKPGANIFVYIEAAWMFATGVYLVASHIRRLKASRRFDRSVHGDLDHGIFLASYQMRLSRIMSWNLLPLGAIMVFSGLETGKLFKVCVVILVSYTLAFFAVRKGDRINKRRKRGLQILKDKLEADS